MDYKKIYNALITKIKNEIRVKSKGVYYEGHHIIPKCFGGEGDSRNPKHFNIVLLTPKEHYIAHLLLVKIYPDSPAMKKALWNMCNTGNENRYKPSSKLYERIRNEYIESVSGEGNYFYGKKHSAESKKKIGEASKGRKTFLNKKHSSEAKEKIKIAATGRKTKEETKQKISKSLSGENHYNAKKIICIETNKIYGSGKELSEELNIPFSTVRRWLNGTTLPPAHFKYKRLN
jgi:hypothetical protein